jgi:hypothetical protein
MVPSGATAPGRGSSSSSALPSPVADDDDSSGKRKAGAGSSSLPFARPLRRLLLRARIFAIHNHNALFYVLAALVAGLFFWHAVGRNTTAVGRARARHFEKEAADPPQ